ncbi:hypothetical protein [Pseudoxanthomonas sp. PXM02]|uniref:hypothetical protein n=1 Tax=Pseudoxanthomonas sp. PXM02 TaxID=2769294 RepID=UPI001786154F|nr:hypothetical protein [Pseudoxanthomonas sp. PXM02]MBD9478538.1 hypothetical protein [Pseudoxanthomonas sp. PXM02]
MKRNTRSPQRDGWSSAQAPRLVAGHQLPDESVAPSKRKNEADALRAAVEAHIASGGHHEVIAAPVVPRFGRLA